MVRSGQRSSKRTDTYPWGQGHRTLGPEERRLALADGEERLGSFGKSPTPGPTLVCDVTVLRPGPEHGVVAGFQHAKPRLRTTIL